MGVCLLSSSGSIEFVESPSTKGSTRTTSFSAILLDSGLTVPFSCTLFESSENKLPGMKVGSMSARSCYTCNHNLAFKSP